VFLANAAQAFDGEGKLADEKLRKLVADYLAGFAKFVDTFAAR
jgi:hypothetical protein